VFTIVDDHTGEKTTIITEYGPFEVGDKHPVQHLIEWIDTNKKGEDECQEIIT
jgi:hypothetical protein